MKNYYAILCGVLLLLWHVPAYANTPTAARFLPLDRSRVKTLAAPARKDTPYMPLARGVSTPEPKRIEAVKNKNAAFNVADLGKQDGSTQALRARTLLAIFEEAHTNQQ